MSIRIFLILTVFTINACIFGVNETSNSSSIKPGIYRGDYGIVSSTFTAESEMILGNDGQVRFIRLRSNTPVNMTKAAWKVQDTQMIWNTPMISYGNDDDGMDFGGWETLATDTSGIRNVSADGFERFEFIPDSLGRDIKSWVRYRVQNPLPTIAEGRYEYYPDPATVGSLKASRSYLEISHTGLCREGRFIDSIPLYEFEGQHCGQTGSFFIYSDDRARDYYYVDTLFGDWGEIGSDFEFIFRVQNIQRDSFDVWLVPDFTFKDGPYWATYHRVSP